ncbi:MAG: hypothetical protein ACP5NF_11725, partial [Thermoanaerobaculum sp.]
INNVYGTVGNEKGDLTASLAAGLYGLVPFRKVAVLGLYGIPEYQWWRKLVERRAWNGRYGTVLVVEGARWRVNGELSERKEAVFAAWDLWQTVTSRRDLGRGDLEFRALGSLWVFAGAAEARVRFRKQDLGEEAFPLLQLERNERSKAAGLRWRPSHRFAFGVGYANLEGEFTSSPQDRSYDGHAWLADLRWQGRAMALELEAQRNDLKPRPGSAFAPFVGTTWNYRLTSDPDRPWQWGVYGHRYITWSAGVAGYAIDRRSGALLGWRGRSRLAAGVFAEVGMADLAGGGGQWNIRAQGVRLDWSGYGPTGLSLGATREERTGGGESVTVTRFLASLRFSSARGWWR